jgi:putative ABC transport system permease protein
MNDLRFAIRQLLKNPGFAAVAILALGLGIGANTAIFSVVNSVLLRPLPYHEPERLVRVYENLLEQGWRQNSVAAGNYLDWRGQNTTFEDMAVMGGGDINLTGNGEPVRIKGAKISSSFFNVFKINPLIGRAFLPEDDQHGSHYTAILAHGFWKTRFGSDPNVIGKTIILNLRTHEIVGVMPADFRFIDADTQIFTPLAFTPDQVRNRGSHSFRVIGRLKPGVTVAQADADLDAISRRAWNEQYMKGWEVDIIPLQERIVGKSRPALLLLLGSVGFVGRDRESNLCPQVPGCYRSHRSTHQSGRRWSQPRRNRRYRQRYQAFRPRHRRRR